MSKKKVLSKIKKLKYEYIKVGSIIYSHLGGLTVMFMSDKDISQGQEVYVRIIKKEII